ncbi:MAG TPA: glycine oxidase ThiO [Rhodothermales bacterium]|nr:glycine oxidase ThiO [Rhodothermales bacterium]
MGVASEKPFVIIGAGAIGLSIGWELVRAGRPVTIFERGEAGQGTSWLAAGMLAADAEIGFEEMDLYRLSRASLDRWPEFAARVEEDSGLMVDYRTEGTLMVADDRDSAARLRRVFDFQRSQDLPVQWLTGSEALDIEPFLAPRLAAAVWSESDHQVDNRQLVLALREAFLRKGGVLREHTAVQEVLQDETAPAIITEAGERVEAACIVVAAGVWSGSIPGLDETARPAVRPVKGQMVQLAIEPPFALAHVVRGPQAYLAPKSSGRLVVGATMEEMGFDTRVTAGGLYRLLEGAWEVVPGIYDLPVTETWAGLRPGTRDNAPLLGWSSAPGVMMATGHFRHGILLTPITAEAIAQLLLRGETSPLLAPFSPQRFQTGTFA